MLLNFLGRCKLHECLSYLMFHPWLHTASLGHQSSSVHQSAQESLQTSQGQFQILSELSDASNVASMIT